MRIGWLADKVPFRGGAEYEAAELLRSAPADVEIVDCPPEAIARDVDAYVIHNCTSYGADTIEALSARPVIKRVHDLWTAGDVKLRAWLIEHAHVVLCSSPLHVRFMNWAGLVRVADLIPSAIDAETFIWRNPPVARIGAVWIGRLYGGKGIAAAAAWAQQQGTEVDVYGFGPLQNALPQPLRFCGQLPHENVAAVLAQYQTFVFLPDAPEPFGRVAVEAWLAGCEMVVNENVGALWWIRNKPDEVTRGATMFWRHVQEAVR